MVAFGHGFKFAKKMSAADEFVPSAAKVKQLL